MKYNLLRVYISTFNIDYRYIFIFIVCVRHLRHVNGVTDNTYLVIIIAAIY